LADRISVPQAARDGGYALLVLLLAATVLTMWAGPAAAQEPAPVRHYNLACDAALVGDTDEALLQLGQAIDAGFDDLRYAAEDPDLAGVRDLPRFEALLQELASRLSLLASERGTVLDHRQWSPPLELHPEVSGKPEVSATSSENDPLELRVRWRSEALDLELTAGDQWSGLITPGAAPPWHGGPALLVTLAVPDGTSDFESANTFQLAFGTEKGVPVGAIHIPQQDRWQRVLELDPKVKAIDVGKTTRWSISIPWQSILPYNPLVDPQLGINAVVRVPAAPGGSLVGSLLPDPRHFQPESRIRRMVPLGFRRESFGEEMVVGRISASISDDKPLALELAIVSEQAGSGTLRVDFMDEQGNSVLPDGPRPAAQELSAGFNSLARLADFSSLQTGAYRIGVAVRLPSGRNLSWSGTVLQLSRAWLAEARQQVDRLPAAERATVRFYLQTIDQTLASHQTRRHPGAIATTLVTLRQMLNQADATGSIVPEKGVLTLVYPGPGSTDRLCTVYFPPGHRGAASVRPVLVLNDARGLENRIVDRIERSYEFGPTLPSQQEGRRPTVPVYVVPHLPAAGGDIHAAALAEATAARQWCQTTFAVPITAVAGIDFSGGTALRLVHAEPERIESLMILAGRHLDPWPGATDAYLLDQLGPAPTDLPVAWTGFPAETEISGQADRLLSVIKVLGYQIVEEVEVKGGLNLVQAADRIVRWAELIR